MGKMGKFSAAGFKQFQKQMEKIPARDMDAFLEGCAKELAARLLARVIKRTPVGDYSKEVEVKAKSDSKNHKKGDTYQKRINPSGKMGGTLRRGWTARTHEEAENGKGASSGGEARAYVDSLKIEHIGGRLVVEIINPVGYASYVEYGHRTASHKGWVPGRFMLTISEKEIQGIAPKVLEGRIKKYLGECMK